MNWREIIHYRPMFISYNMFVLTPATILQSTFRELLDTLYNNSCNQLKYKSEADIDSTNHSFQLYSDLQLLARLANVFFLQFLSFLFII